MPPGRLYTPVPLVRGHPLNAGVVRWWQGLPGQSGGPTVPDLWTGGRSAAATRSNGPSWVSGPSGRPALSCGGTAYADSGMTLAAMVGSSPPGVSVSWWMRPDTAFNSGAIRGIWGATNGGGTPEFSCQVYSDNNWYVGFNNGSGDFRVTTAATATNYPQGTWSHYTFSATVGGFSYLYRNGSQIGSKTSGAVVFANPSDTFTFGRQGSGASAYLPGAITEVVLFARPLSAAEASGLWDQARQNYPDTQRWVPARRAALLSPPPPPPPSSGAFLPAFTPGFGW